jgi:hypothetical protein
VGSHFDHIARHCFCRRAQERRTIGDTNKPDKCAADESATASLRCRLTVERLSRYRTCHEIGTGPDSLAPGADKRVDRRRHRLATGPYLGEGFPRSSARRTVRHHADLVEGNPRTVCWPAIIADAPADMMLSCTTSSMLRLRSRSHGQEAPSPGIAP